MQTIETFKLPIVPGEIKIELSANCQLFDAWEGDPGGITVGYIRDADADATQLLTFYIFRLDDELVDNFPGRYFKTIHLADGETLFLYFRPPYTKREPIVVTPKLTDEQRAVLDERVNESGNE